MFRTAFTRPLASIHPTRSLLASRALSTAPFHYRAIRFNSTKSSSEMTIDSDKVVEAKNEARSLKRDWDAVVLTYEEVKAKSESPSPDAYLIDVREPDEVILGSIPSSVNVPLSTLPNDLHLNDLAFKDKFGFEKPRKDQEVVFYCRSGKRSASASDIAKRNGYSNIYNYSGSWLDWVAREGIKV